MSHEAITISHFEFERLRSSEFRPPVLFTQVDGNPGQYDIKIGDDGKTHRVLVTDEVGYR